MTPPPDRARRASSAPGRRFPGKTARSVGRCAAVKGSLRRPGRLKILGEPPGPTLSNRHDNPRQ